MGITIHAFFIFKAYTLSEIKGERMRTCLALDGTKPLHTIQRSCAVKGTTSCHPARCPRREKLHAMARLLFARV